MKTIKIIGLVIGALVLLVVIFAKVNRISPLSWGHKAVNQPIFSDQAINGYDPVAYHTENKPTAGIEDHTHQWNDATWYFSSKENKDLFKANPEKYAPQYGGYCAFAVSKGFSANVGDSFEISDGKLYLFSDDDVKSDWLSDKVANLNLGNANW